jgi:inorganic triphosphatase YgiF
MPTVHDGLDGSRARGQSLVVMSGTHESEASLLIDAADPTPVARAVAALSTCAGYALRPRPVETLHDVYVDRADGLLATHRLGLRVRVVDERAPLVTLKGPARARGHRLERLEVEGPLVSGAWAAVRRAAAEVGVSLEPLPGGSTPLERLATLGLRPTHERTTERTPRDVMADGRIRAELVVDVTSVRLRGGVARYAEIEIEAKDEDAGAVVDTVVEALLQAYGPAVRAWPHSKLGVGLTLARLDEAGDLARHLAGEWVQPSGMRLVANMLESKRA